MVRQIELTQGQVALVDDFDFEALSVFNWYAHHRHKTWYAVRHDCSNHSKTIRMHRQIMHPPDHLVIDHINHDGLDNRRANLRIVTSRQNLLNCKRRPRGQSSRYRGVRLHESGLWQARITLEPNRQTFLGYFQDEKDAAAAYNRAAIEYRGEFAQLNDLD